MEGVTCVNLFQLTGKEAADLNAFGMSPHLYGAVMSILISVQFITFFIVGCLLYYYGLKDRVLIFASILLIASGTALGVQPEVFQPTTHMDELLHVVNFVGGLYLFFLFIYPDGKFVPKWMILPAIYGLVGTIGDYFLNGTILDPQMWPGLFRTGSFLTLHALIVYSQIYRYRTAKTIEEKRQIKWFIGSLASFLVAVFVSILLQNVDHGLAKLLTWFVFYVGLLFMPFAIGISILERRLQQMALLFNKTIVYISMTVFVMSMYVIVVGSFGAAFQSNGNVFVTLFATGLAAVLFQPLRNVIQRGVNRLVYGDREEPYTVLSQLSQRMEATLTHSSLMFQVVEGVTQALRIPFVSIDVEQEGKLRTLASRGIPDGTISELPLYIQGEKVGVLRLGVRSWKETLPPGKYHLLDDLIRHVGIAVQAVRLSDELQRSRERLVMAREEERRRLRRDLHDGLGADLSSISLRIGNIVHSDKVDDVTRGKLISIQSQLVQTVGNVRRLVYALRPPALDEFGFAFALREIAFQFTDTHVHIAVDTEDDLPTLPAAVEVAGYRIVQEAVSNTVRHSMGTSCCVKVWIVKASLCVEIKDNGKGLPLNPKKGIGLQSMRERAEEVGGRITVTSTLDQGTTVFASIPLWEEKNDDNKFNGQMEDSIC